MIKTQSGFQPTEEPAAFRRLVGFSLLRILAACILDADMIDATGHDILASMIAVHYETRRRKTWQEQIKSSLGFVRGIGFRTKYGSEVGDTLRMESVGVLEGLGQLLGN